MKALTQDEKNQLKIYFWSYLMADGGNVYDCGSCVCKVDCQVTDVEEALDVAMKKMETP